MDIYENLSEMEIESFSHTSHHFKTLRKGKQILFGRPHREASPPPSDLPHPLGTVCEWTVGSKSPCGSPSLEDLFSEVGGNSERSIIV